MRVEAGLQEKELSQGNLTHHEPKVKFLEINRVEVLIQDKRQEQGNRMRNEKINSGRCFKEKMGRTRERERFLDTRVLYDHFTLIPTSVAFKAVKSSSTAPGK